MPEPAEPYPVRQIERLEVIRTTALAGKGTDDDHMRLVEQYWTLDGKLLFKVDPWQEKQREGDQA